MTWIWPLALSAILVAYNSLMNRWPPFNGALYVPLNLGFSISIAVLTAIALEMARAEIGIAGDPGDAVIGALGALAFTVAALTVGRSRKARLIADRRVTGLAGRALAYQVLLRVPLGTAVAEELLFRGVLFASWREAGLSDVGAALCASIAFGLWHVSPTINLVEANDPAASARKIALTVGGAVAFTALAGLALTWLRLETHGLVAPIVLHAGINSGGTLAAVAAGQRSDLPSPGARPPG